MSSTRFEILQRENARLSTEIADLAEQLQSTLSPLTQLRQQVDWFKRQLFGRTSGWRLEVQQSTLSAALGIEVPLEAEGATQTISYHRRENCRNGAVNEQGLRFDDTVPWRRWRLPT